MGDNAKFQFIFQMEIKLKKKKLEIFGFFGIIHTKIKKSKMSNNREFDALLIQKKILNNKTKMVEKTF